LIKKQIQEPVMLTEKEMLEIEEEAGKYDSRQAASIDALMIIQRHRGWVDDDSLKDVAAYLGMSPDYLDGIATFYNMIFRKPVGKHVILMCNTISCMMAGYEPNREHLRKRLGVDLGGTTPDGFFTTLPVACLGACERSPSMMVDGRLYTGLTPERIDAILDGLKEKR